MTEATSMSAGSKALKIPRSEKRPFSIFSQERIKSKTSYIETQKSKSEFKF